VTWPPFDPDEWTDHDLARTFGALPIRFAWIVAGHEDAPGVLDLAGELAAIVGLVTPTDAERHELEEATVRGEAVLRDAAALVAPLLADAGGPGAVAGLFRSDGGVPKLPIDEAVVGWRGVTGDRQAARVHHGRVWQALCLWSLDVVEALQAEGHPIEPGQAGENISIRGLDWAALRPGTLLHIGDVTVELSAYATPCKKNAAWFVAGDFDRMSHDRHPGTSRLYASVLETGTVRPGDPVTVLR
jgi:MOSC domain-containing protein YiiM